MVATTTPAVRHIIDQAMQLSPAERERIAFELLDSVDPPPNRFETKEALQAELKRRIEAYERGEMKGYTLEEAMAKIRKARARNPRVRHRAIQSVGDLPHRWR